MVADREPRGPTQQTLKRLFALSGNRCSFPRCTTALVQNETVIGEVCHIKGARPGAARYDEQQTDSERHAFANLILMCPTHHTVIDDDEESYTVERLIKLKTDHESRVSIDAGFGEHATDLFIDQKVTSTNQSGGLTAHNINTLNFHQGPASSDEANPPNWSIRDLFLHVRPNINSNAPTSVLDEVGGDVLDKLSSGQLMAWGREIFRGSTTSFLSLSRIDRTYWRAARFTYVFLLDDHERDKHVTQSMPSNLADYADLQVNREKAIELWPHPLRDRWTPTELKLSARYFNAPADQISVGCKTVALYDPHIESHVDASGSPQYERIVAPGYVLATGVDMSPLRSITWVPQHLEFHDPETGAPQQFFLTGRFDTSGAGGRVKFFVEFQLPNPGMPVPKEIIKSAKNLFGERRQRIEAGADAPAVLVRGPKLILQVIPISAFQDGRPIEHSRPKSLAIHFMPDGYERCEGRPRQEGWIWFQPPQPAPGLPNPVSHWHSRLDWNGYVEIVLTVDEADEQERVQLIRGYPFERYIVRTLDAVAEGYQQLDIRSSMVIGVTLAGVLGTKLSKSTPGHSKGFDRPVITSDAIGLTKMEKPLGRTLRPILDELWRAAGWADGSPSFGRGDWDGYANSYPYR